MVNGAKVLVELFIFNIFGLYVSLVHSDFNFEEIYGVKYGFEISKEPVLLKESPGLGNTLLLSSKHGQQYQCILPQLETSEKENEENKILSKDEIPLLLEPLKKKCLYNNKGWWTYEVCFGKGIYQYHEEANQAVGDKISLGVFSNESDWSQEKIEKVKPKPGKSAVIKNFHSQYYVNGSECDLTGKARETQIKIYCEEGSADLVLRVDEPSSCSYVITVYTNKLCKHSLFRSLHAQEPQPITCSPALSEERYKIYIEGVESQKRAKAEAEAARLKIKKARAATEELDAEDEIEEDENDDVSFKKKNKRSRHSQVWPWQNPGVESEDEVWIDGQIKDNEIDISRLDITKVQKTNENGERLEEGLTVTSRSLNRRREERKKGDVEKKGKGHADDNMKQKEVTKTDDTEQVEGDDDNDDNDDDDDDDDDDGDDDDKHKDAVVSEKDSDKDSEKKESERGDKSDDTEEEKAATSDDVNKKIGKEATGKERDPMDKKWKEKMEEEVLKLRSSLKEKLVQFGINPKVLDQKFKEKLGSVMGKDGEKGESTATAPDANGGEDGQEAEKVEEKEKETPEMEKLEKMATKDPFLKSFADIHKILDEDMLKEILNVAAETHAEMERKFSEERALMKSNVKEMRAKIQEIEDAEKRSEVKNEKLRETMSKIKASIDRFEKTNKEFDEDMQAVRELNSEIVSVIGNKKSGDTKRDLLQLSFKTNRLLKKILLRRFQLEQEALYIKRMSNKVANRQDGEDLNMDIDSHKDGIDQVINKLKKMVQDLDITGDNTGGVAEETAATPDSHTTAGVRDEELNSDQGDTRVKVRVSKIKKVATDDDDDDEDSEMAETDLDAQEMEDLNMEKRIRFATKKMEEMVKQQLKDSGVVPSGKIKVKIVTSKDVLESMDGKNDVKLLSEREETQFRDMILGLLGGSPEAGKERRRQQDLQSNYNLVWNDDGLQELPREDDDADGEVEVESF